MQTTKSEQAGERTQDEINATMPHSITDDYTGKTVVVRKDFFSAAYADGDRRFRAGGGFGCSPVAIGQAVFGQFVSDGEECRVNRSDIEGIAVNQG